MTENRIADEAEEIIQTEDGPVRKVRELSERQRTILRHLKSRLEEARGELETAREKVRERTSAYEAAVQMAISEGETVSVEEGAVYRPVHNGGPPADQPCEEC